MRKFLSLLLAAVMVTSLAGCSGNTQSESSQEQGSSASESTSQSTDSQSQSDEESSAVSTSAPEEEQIPEVAYQLGGELTPTMISNSVLNKGNQARLAKVIKQLQNGGSVTVAYLGGSITQGSSAGDELCYAKLTSDWLVEQFPEAKIVYANAGIGATGSYIGIHRADRDVLECSPNLVFIDFSVNDTSDRMAINKAAYEGLIRKLWNSDSQPAIICLAMTQEDGTSVQDAHYEIAKKYDIPMISYRNAILDVIDKGYIVWDDISDDNIHPNVQGHAVLTQMITNYLQSVIDTVDTIDTTEPELPEADASGTKYENAEIVVPGDERCTALGVFMEHNSVFGNFGQPWVAKVTAGTEITGGLEFTVNAKNIGVLYGKVTSNGGLLDVYVDGELAMSINCTFPNGWGNYVEFQEVVSFDEAGEHTVKLVPQESDAAALYYVSALAIS